MKIYPVVTALDYEASLVVAGLVVDKIKSLQREKQPISRVLQDVSTCLTHSLAATASSSQARTNGVAAVSLSTAEEELIGVGEAAAILAVSKRYVQRIAASDLDGKKVAGHWLFDRTVVEEYAEERSGRAHSA